jgi:hypothetical protein
MFVTKTRKACVASCAAAILTIVWLGAALAQDEEPHEEPTSGAQEKALPAGGSPLIEKQTAAPPTSKDAKSNPVEKKTETAAKKAKKKNMNRPTRIPAQGD